jgi:carbon starvation protein
LFLPPSNWLTPKKVESRRRNFIIGGVQKTLASITWLAVALLGAWAFLTLARGHGQDINSLHLLVAALCAYAIGYRFYSKWIAARVLMLDDRRATPCEVHDDGRDFVKTNKWIVFGHHFAAISGPGPLVGPVLAAQFGFLPGALWILLGVVLGGAVQDFVILFCSLRRDGKSLGQMVREELNGAAGWVAQLAILAILVILLAVLALVVVNALAESPWAVFTVGATIPIALVMGGYLRVWRVGKVLEATVIVLLLLAVWGGQCVYAHPAWAARFTFHGEPLAWAILAYGFAASVLPIWLLLAPRDYLSTFVKLGTIALLAVGIFLLLPKLHMPALTTFAATGNGPVFAGKLFPFCFITIACGAISGFHSLIASGTTPKILSRESCARRVGYGAMCLESLVAIMALIAACTLEPGVYFSINMKGDPAATIAKVTSLGYPATLAQMDQIATTVGEKTLFGRVGGAPTLAIGLAQLFSKAFHGAGMDLWYHFAIMFEALFILTTLDAGTRVGRYLLQDLLGQAWRPLGRTQQAGPAWLASFLVVAAWGWFLIQGVRDPLGGINSLWPLFGMANQLLAAIALCLGTTVILKMQLADGARRGRPALAWITLGPLLWLLAVTMTAGVEKIFHPDPRIGFLAAAEIFKSKLPALKDSLDPAWHTTATLYFNAWLDALVTGALLAMILLIVMLSVREWILLLARRKLCRLSETPPVWLPAYALAESKPWGILSLLTLALLLVKELSGETAVERAQQSPPAACPAVCATRPSTPRQLRAAAYLHVTRRRFDGINRCC